MLYDDRRMAGLTIFVGVFQFLIGLMVAAAVDPSYSIHGNTISDLGVREGAGIFNGSIVILGILLATAAYFVDRALKTRWFTFLLLVAAMGAVGVGIFTKAYPAPHTLFSLVAFLAAGITAIAASRFVTPPLSYVSILVGTMSLVALVLFATGAHLGLGDGGMERMIVLPVLGWGLAFGGYLLAPPPPNTGAMPRV